jgi:hypothetical protein
VAAAKGRALIQSSDEHLFSLAALFRWKVSNPLLIGVTAVCGLIAHPLLQPQSHGAWRSTIAQAAPIPRFSSRLQRL